MYYDKLDALQKVYLASDLVIEKKYREEATKASKLETELSILRAEVEVLRKLEDKSDEFKNVIQTLELQLKDKGNEYSDFIKSLELIIADNTTRIELMSMNSKRDEKEITELKSQLKEANDRIFAFTTKEPIIVRPETVTPYVVEPVVLSPKK
jgi:DNA anti-recombination protein RmuC